METEDETRNCREDRGGTVDSMEGFAEIDFVLFASTTAHRAAFFSYFSVLSFLIIIFCRFFHFLAILMLTPPPSGHRPPNHGVYLSDDTLVSHYQAGGGELPFT